MHFSVEKRLRRKFAQDYEFCKDRASAKARAKANGDLWHKKLVKYIDDAVDGQLLKQEVVNPEEEDEAKKIYQRKGILQELGYDHAQPFNKDKKQHSTGFIYTKNADASPEVRK